MSVPWLGLRDVVPVLELVSDCWLRACLFRQRLFENLRMLPHAPGVQMQAIPEDPIPDDTVDEDAEDPDKRLSSKSCSLSLLLQTGVLHSVMLHDNDDLFNVAYPVCIITDLF